MAEVTEAAAADQRVLVQEAVGAAHGLGAMARTTDAASCRETLAVFLRKNPRYVFAGFAPVDGTMRCSTSPNEAIDLTQTEDFQASIDRAEIYTALSPSGELSGAPVFVVSVPVFDGPTLTGMMALSIALDRFSEGLDDSQIRDGLALLGITTKAQVFDMFDPMGADALAGLPVDITPDSLKARSGTSFVANDSAGNSRFYTVRSAANDSYTIVGSWPYSGPASNGTLKLALLPMLFAILMWLASMTVAYIGLNQLVLRHLAELRSGMRRFALGERGGPGVLLDGAPDEFKDAQRAFNRMTLLITDAEAKQQSDLQDKEVLLREIHHRVKNNLQMIASIMNLQSRSAQTSEARSILESLKRRVSALATLHRSLYNQPETSRVNARDLIGAVVSETSLMSPNPRMVINTDIAAVLLYPDQAVPLSMWVAEALMNAMKHARIDENERVKIALSLTVSDTGDVFVKMTNPADAPEDDAPQTGLGSKLMLAFERQLDGTAEHNTQDGVFTRTLRFQAVEFEPIEQDEKAQAAA
ncbi:sensor histidine kinase [Shimia ponticola]|uniref:sensor histidine kinase n=1 Tax=Shimia ponticola TaxID=2582893 RepID=UPI00164CAD33|nr:sensor histidine kinase [Shimia ponticola]